MDSTSDEDIVLRKIPKQQNLSDAIIKDVERVDIKIPMFEPDFEPSVELITLLTTIVNTMDVDEIKKMYIPNAQGLIDFSIPTTIFSGINDGVIDHIFTLLFGTDHTPERIMELIMSKLCSAFIVELTKNIRTLLTHIHPNLLKFIDGEYNVYLVFGISLYFVHHAYTTNDRCCSALVCFSIVCIYYDVPDLIKQMYDDYTKPVAQAYGLSSIKNIIVLFIYAKMFPGKEMNAKGFLKYIENFTRRTEDVSSFISFVIEIIQKITDYVCVSVIGTKSFTFLNTDSDKLNDWMVKTRDVVTSVRLRQIPYDTNSLSRLVLLELEYSNIIKDLDRATILSLAGSCRPVLDGLLNLKNEMMTSGLTTKILRPEPVVTLLRGKPGVGKTTMIMPFMYEVIFSVLNTAERERYAKHPDDLLYIRNPEVKFWDGYYGQKAIIIDEYGITIGPHIEAENDATAIMRLAGSFLYHMHAAAMELKQNLFMSSEFVFCTSNIHSIMMDARAKVSCPEAVVRRFDFDIEVDVIDKYKLSCGKPNYEKLAALEGINRDVYVFTLNNHLENTKKHITWDEAVELQVKSFIKKRSKVLSRDNDVRSSIERGISNYDNSSYKDELERVLEPVLEKEAQMVTEPNDLGISPWWYFLYSFTMWCFMPVGYIPFVNISRMFLLTSMTTMYHSFVNIRDICPLWIALKFDAFRTSMCLLSQCLVSASNMKIISRRYGWIVGRIVNLYASVSTFYTDDKYLQLIKLGLFAPRFFGELYAQTFVYLPVNLFLRLIWGVPIPLRWLFSRCDPKFALSICSSTYWLAKTKSDLKKRATLFIKCSQFTTFVNKGTLHLVRDYMSTNVRYFVIMGITFMTAVVGYKTYNRSEKVEAQGNESVRVDDNAYAIVAKLYSRSLYRVHYKDREPGYICALGDNLFCAPYHFFLMFSRHKSSDPHFEIESLVTRDRTMVDISHILHTIEVHPHKDMFLFEIPNVPKHAHISHLFCEAAELQARPTGLAVMPIPRDDVFHTIKMKYTIHSREIKYSVFGTEIMLPNSIRYEAGTLPGHCGLPVVMIDPSVRAHKIIGFHVAGERATRQGFCCLFGEIRAQFNMEMPAFRKKFDLVRAPSTANKSSIRRSPLYGAWGPAKTAPARLKKFEVDGIEINPYRKALEKYGKEKPKFDRKIMQHCITSLKSTLSNLGPLCKISFEEAVLGDPGDPYNNAIPRNTSAGYPDNVIPRPGYPGKTRYFGRDSEYDLTSPDCIELRREIEVADANLPETDDMDHLHTTCLKDERRPLDRVQSGSTRLFSGAPLRATILFSMYFKKLISALMHTRTDTGICPGLNPYGREWDMMAKELKSYYSEIAGDYSGFDASQLAEIMDEIGEMLFTLFDDREFDENRRALWRRISHSLNIMGESVFEWEGGLPSGHLFTTMMNCLYNLVLIRYMFVMCHGGDPKILIEFKDNIKPKVYGDDHVIGVSEKYTPTFNGVTFQEECTKLGIKYTSDTKSSEIAMRRTIDDVTFLKRSFRFDIRLNRYVAPLALSTILETPYWTREGPGYFTTPVQAVDNALYELSLHDYDTFSLYAPKILEASWKRLAYIPVITDYELLQEIIICREYAW